MRGLLLSLLLPFTTHAQGTRPLDDFSDASHWRVVASNQVGAAIRIVDDGQGGKALCLDYDFNGVSGFAGIQRDLPLDYPQHYAFSFALKADSPRNDLQFKLIDDSGDNVWWVNSPHFDFPKAWQDATYRSGQIAKAWGPGPDPVLHHSAKLEFTIYKNVAGGEKGSVCLDRLAFAPLPATDDPPLPPTPNEQVEALAKKSPRGTFPRSFSGEQNYWTLLGVDGGGDTGLMNEDGEIELGKSQPSVAPSVQVDGKQVTWADVRTAQSLQDGYLPIPAVQWTHAAFKLDISAFAQGRRGDSQLVARYRLSNTTQAPHDYRLALQVQPFQVNPPQQFLNTPGGIAPINLLRVQGGDVVVNGERAMHADVPDSVSNGSFGDEGRGLYSSRLIYHIHLQPGQSREVDWFAPLEGKAQRPGNFDAEVAQAQVARQWRGKLDVVRLDLPEQAQAFADTLRGAQAQILLSRDGPMLRPGTRSYARSWIRDGAMMSEALLRTGHADVVRDYLRWYVQYQFKDGMVPCCVDARGADPVPENDSHGELIHAIAEYARYTGDTAFLREMWPHVQGAFAYMEKLRLSERTEENRAKNPAFYGLMPVSISHEGYSAKPMHSYWDDAWALRGYIDAAWIARQLGEQDDAKAMAAARDAFRSDVLASLRSAMQQHGIDYLPGCAELGDFDPTSSTMWFALGLSDGIPQAALQATWRRYWNEFDARAKGARAWKDFTPYEWRNVVAFVRLGWRDRANDAVKFFFDHQQPKGWNQWAEVVSSTPRKPFFLGDLPHAWVASDFIRSVLDMFAYVDDDDALVLAAGVPSDWLQGEGIAIRGLQTPFGALSYSLQRDGSVLKLHVDGELQMPRGGIVLHLPGKDVRVRSLPANIEVR